MINKFLSCLITLLMCFIPLVYGNAAPDVTPVTDVLRPILTTMFGLAGAICVGKIIHIGILYMTSSAVDKSNAKAALIPWVIGTIVCFGASWIGPFFVNMFKITGDVLDIE